MDVGVWNEEPFVHSSSFGRGPTLSTASPLLLNFTSTRNVRKRLATLSSMIALLAMPTKAAT